MPANRRDEEPEIEDGPREYGVLHEADAPRSGWASLGVHEGRERVVMIDRDSRGDDEHAT